MKPVRSTGRGKAREKKDAGLVMIVDDDRNIGRLLKTLFELEGHHVVEASTCQEVLPLLRQALPDVALMDVQLHGQETIALVRQMRQDEKAAHIPVVMTSAMDRRRECLEAGADLFIIKPFLPDELVQTVIDLLKR